MKIFIILFISMTFVACFGFSKSKHVSSEKNETLIIFFNSKDNYPGQITESEFWDAKGDLDTIVILSNRLNDLLDKKISLLKDTTINTGGADEFYHAVAFIRERNRVKDTIYAAPLFKYWKKGNRHYIDNTGFFQKSFGDFVLN